MNKVIQSFALARRTHRFVNRPYYLYRPLQIAIRLRVKVDLDGSPRLLRTAWGSHLYCWPDTIGQAVARTGVYDLIVAETLARLVDPGETAVDAGANVGFMSNLLAYATGKSGHVISFEPHPLIFETLTSNVARWEAIDRIDTISVRQAAVSSSAGTLPLTVRLTMFAHNKGTASLERPDTAKSTDVEMIEVETVRLDDEFSAPIGVLKLDVEGHELAALRGAESLLSGKLIRDVLFEEHQSPPTPVTTLFEAHGYTVLGVHQGLAGPILSPPADAYNWQLWDPPGLLATIDPERARQRLKRRGWVCLRAFRGGERTSRTSRHL